MKTSNDLELLLIEPRGFCAGVTRAIEILEKVVEKYPAPVYVKNEIVHNKHVVNYFNQKGVIFVKNIQDVPKNSVTIFSAHGVSNKVEEVAKEKSLTVIDATCPLVRKVHKKSLEYYNNNYHIIMIGHNNHPEVEGTLGRVPKNITLVSSEQEAHDLDLDPNLNIRYITQTTLSLYDTENIINILKTKYPSLENQNEKNICYATQNRQEAIYSIIDQVDGLLIVGSKNSSNSNRLMEIGLKYSKPSFLIDSKDEIPYEELSECNKIAISAGASAPEESVTAIINDIQSKRNTKISIIKHIEENTKFFLPKELRE